MEAETCRPLPSGGKTAVQGQHSGRTVERQQFRQSLESGGRTTSRANCEMTEGYPALLGSQGRDRHPSETTTGLVLTQRCFRRRQQGGIALKREGFRALIPCQPGRCRWTPGGRQTLPLQQSAVSQRHTQQLRGPIAGTSRFTDDPGLITLLHEAFTIHRGRQGRPIRAPQDQPPANPCWNTTTNPRLQAKDRQQVSLWSITQ